MQPHDVLSAFGIAKSLLDWADDVRCRVKASEFIYRLRAGWAPERALTEPSTHHPRKSLFKGVTFNGCRNTWLARYWDGENLKHLGSFHGKSGEIQAALAFDRAAADRDDGELNFPSS